MIDVRYTYCKKETIQRYVQKTVSFSTPPKPRGNTNQQLCPGRLPLLSLNLFKMHTHWSQMHITLCRLLVSLTKSHEHILVFYSTANNNFKTTLVVMLILVFSWVLVLCVWFWHYKQCWNSLLPVVLLVLYFCRLAFPKWIYWADTCAFYLITSGLLSQTHFCSPSVKLGVSLYSCQDWMCSWWFHVVFLLWRVKKLTFILSFDFQPLEWPPSVTCLFTYFAHFSIVLFAFFLAICSILCN